MIIYLVSDLRVSSSSLNTRTEISLVVRTKNTRSSKERILSESNIIVRLITRVSVHSPQINCRICEFIMRLYCKKGQKVQVPLIYVSMHECSNTITRVVLLRGRVKGELIVWVRVRNALLTSAFGSTSTSTSKWNIPSMVTQTQMQRMGRFSASTFASLLTQC